MAGAVRAGDRYRDAVPARLRPSLLLIPLLVACVLLGVRGVARGLDPGAIGGADFTMVYAGARAWWLGLDPYDHAVLIELYTAAGGGRERDLDPRWFASLYPPTTYAVLGPLLGWAAWPWARLIWMATNLVAWAGGGLLGDRLLRQGGAGPAGRLGWAAVWAGFGAVHTTLAFGQLGLVTGVLAVAGLVGVAGVARASRGFRETDRPDTGRLAGARRLLWPGLALAVASALKPQLAGFFVLAAIALRPAVLMPAAATGLALVVLAVGRLAAAGPDAAGWLGTLRHNLAAFRDPATAGLADPTPANPFTYQMIHLAPGLHRLGLGLGPVAGVLGWAAGLGLVAIVLHHLRRRGPIARDPAALAWAAAGLGAASLLVVYHRYYDAVVLLAVPVWLGLAWQNRRAWTRTERAGVALVAAGFALLMIPGTSMLAMAVRRGWLPEVVTGVPGFDALVLHHGVWATAAVALGLGLAVPRTSGLTAPPAPAPAPPPSSPASGSP